MLAMTFKTFVNQNCEWDCSIPPLYRRWIDSFT